METMIEKFCKKYKLPERLLLGLVSHMEKVSFRKGELVLRTGERDTHFYLLEQGVWRACHVADGVERSMWFVGAGEVAFSSWGYLNGEPSLIDIESVTDSVAYCTGKEELEALFSSSIDMANFGRKIFEREILSFDHNNLTYGSSNARERYLKLMEDSPELLQQVPLKYLASYLYITPQSLSRIRAGLAKK